MLLLGIRIHYKQELWIEWYLQNLQHWFKYRKFEITQSSAGQHKDTDNHHLHYHLIIEERKPLTNPISTFRYDYNKAKVTTYSSNLKDYPASMISEEYKGRINISIKMTNSDDPEDFRKFLQYPLKEKLPILDYCKNINVDMVSQKANAEYQLARETHAAVLQKKQKREDKDKSQWEIMCEHLSSLEISSVRSVYKNVFMYYKDNNEKPPTIRFMSDMAERYAFKKGYLSIDQIINTICRY